MRVAVVGAGIAGLSAAWALRNHAELVLIDPEPPGGMLRTTAFEGRPVDEGPDAFITRTPEALALCAELGLEAELVHPDAGRTLLWWESRLRPLPDGLLLGVPARLGPVLRSGLLSPAGAARAGLDLVLPRRSIGRDAGVGALIASRFGSQVAERLVEPLLGGIHAAGLDDLSAEATAPQILAAACRSRSLLLGLRAAAPAGSGQGATPLFATPRMGTAAIVDALVKGLSTAVLQPTTVRRVTPREDRVEVDGEVFDAAVLAVPAPDAARMLGDAAPAGLAEIELTSVALVTMAYPASELPAPEGVNGFLVPASENRLMTACSFGSSKWPHWASPDTTVLRVSTGRRGDQRGFDLDDGALVDRLAGEVGDTLGRPASPRAVRVSRWPRSFPFYKTGHVERVERIEAALARTAPRVALAGSSYRGAGIPACIGSGRRAAASVLAMTAQAARPDPRSR